MAKPRGPVQMWAQYLAVRSAAAALTAFDPELNLRSAASLGRAPCTGSTTDTDDAPGDHLATAFPHWDKKQLDRTCRDSFEHLVQLAVELCHTPRLLHLDTWPRHVTLGGIAPALRRLVEQRPAILLTGHVGNWEVLGYLLATLGLPITALARPIDNPRVNDWLLGIRQRRGLRVLTKFDAAPEMIRILKDGGVLAFIADQNAGDQGPVRPLLQPTCQRPTSPSACSPCATTRAHHLRLRPPRRPPRRARPSTTTSTPPTSSSPRSGKDQPDPLFYITARYNAGHRRNGPTGPGQYLWLHRRWKSRPRHEREGKPMPPMPCVKQVRATALDDRRAHRLARSAKPLSTNADPK